MKSPHGPGNPGRRRPLRALAALACLAGAACHASPAARTRIANIREAAELLRSRFPEIRALPEPLLDYRNQGRGLVAVRAEPPYELAACFLWNSGEAGSHAAYYRVTGEGDILFLGEYRAADKPKLKMGYPLWDVPRSEECAPLRESSDPALLLAASKDTAWWIRYLALQRLGSVAAGLPREFHPSIIDLLTERLGDERALVRGEACSALRLNRGLAGGSPPGTARERLLLLLGDDDEYVRTAAANALQGWIRKEDAGILRETILRLIEKFGATRDPVEPAAASEDVEQMIRLLAQTGSREAFPFLIALLRRDLPADMDRRCRYNIHIAVANALKAAANDPQAAPPDLRTRSSDEEIPREKRQECARFWEAWLARRGT